MSRLIFLFIGMAIVTTTIVFFLRYLFNDQVYTSARIYHTRKEKRENKRFVTVGKINNVADKERIDSIKEIAKHRKKIFKK